MSLAEVFHDAGKHTSGRARDPRFLNMVHDLRALFLHLEEQLPRMQHLPLEKRAAILGGNEDAARMHEVYVPLAFQHTEGKLRANNGWNRKLQEEYKPLLQGIATYAHQVHENLSRSPLFKGTKNSKELQGFCDQVLDFCRTRDAEPEPRTNSPAPANDFALLSPEI